MRRLTTVVWGAVFASLAVIVGGSQDLNAQAGKPGEAAPRLDANGDALPKHAVMRLGSQRFLPTNVANRVEYSHDGKYLATASFETWGSLQPAIQIWERSTGREVTPARLRGMPGTGISWAPDSNHLATSHNHEQAPAGLSVWTVGSDEPKPFAGMAARFGTVVWSPTGDRFAVTICEDERKEVVLLDAKGVEQFRFPLSSEAFAGSRFVDFTPDGERLVVLSDGGIRVYRVDTGKLSSEHHVELKGVVVLQVLPDGKSIAVAGNGVKILAMDGADPVVRQLGEASTFDVAVSPDGQWLFSTGLLELCEVWNLKTGMHQPLCPIQAASVALSPDGAEIALGSRRLSFFKVGSWDQVSPAREHYAGVVTGIINKDRLWTGGLGPTAWEWDLDKGHPVRSLTRKSGTTYAMARIDERRIAVAGRVGQIDVFDVETGRVARQLPGHDPTTHSVVFWPERNQLLSAGMDGNLKCWNPTSGRLVYEKSLVPDFQTGWSKLAIAPNGAWLACLGQGFVQVTRQSDGTIIWRKVDTDFWFDGAFTNDSKRLLIAANDGIRVLGSATATEELRLEAKWSARAPCSSPDDDWAAAAYSKKGDNGWRIRIWSLKTGALAAELEGHADHIRWLSFTPDGKRLLSGSQDTTVLVWDVEEAIAAQRAD